MTTTYRPQMAVNGVSGQDAYVSGTSYDAAGRVTQRNLSGGVMQAVFGYYAWNTGPGDSQGRLASVQTGTTQYPTRLQNLMYHYTVIGNIANITDVCASGQVQNFTYDTLDRLLSANAVGGYGGLYSESYTYDPNTGNLSSKAGVNYTYSPTRVHAVTSLSNGNSYGYDANGNMTSRTVGGVTYTLGYDAENRLVSLTGGGVTAAYIYDGDGNRVKTVVNGVTVTYIGNYFEWSNSVGTKYYYAGSVRVGVRVGTVLDYLFSDHLGSTSITADSAGNLAGGMRYTAWGETRFSGGATPTSFRYTGQRQAEAGLYFYVARMYDPYLNRFLSPDSIIPDTFEPISYDRYEYSRNNPVRYIDPTGHSTECGLMETGCKHISLQAEQNLTYLIPKWAPRLTPTLTETPTINPFEGFVKSTQKQCMVTPTQIPCYKPGPTNTPTPPGTEIDSDTHSAFLIGIGSSKGDASLYNTAAIEVLIMDGQIRIFNNSGQGGAIPGFFVGNVSIYVGQVYNITDFSEYEGPSQSGGVNVSLGPVGITGAIFGGPNKDSPGGWYFGYAPGGGAALFRTNTEVTSIQ